jgi:intraflagellar transport protein 46
MHPLIYLSVLVYSAETLDLSMPDYIKVMCNILDIPVYQNPVESLHIMLTLYLEFKNNPFLAKGHLAGAPVGMGGMSMDAGSNSLMF